MACCRSHKLHPFSSFAFNLNEKKNYLQDSGYYIFQDVEKLELITCGRTVWTKNMKYCSLYKKTVLYIYNVQGTVTKSMQVLYDTLSGLVVLAK